MSDQPAVGHVPTRDQIEARTSYQVAAVVLVIAGIQMLLPDEVTLGAKWVIPAIEVIGAPAALVIMRFSGLASHWIKRGITAYLAFLVLTSVLNASLLLVSMLRGVEDSGGELLFAGFGVLIINVLSSAWCTGGSTVADQLFARKVMAPTGTSSSPSRRAG